jgi:hypothetical protein
VRSVIAVGGRKMENKIIPFPAEPARRRQELERDASLSQDPYYRQLKALFRDAAQCGLLLPRTPEASAQRIYDKHRGGQPGQRILKHERER